MKSFLASVKLTIVLLTLLALFSILGTFIPQHESAEAIIHRLSPGMLTFLQAIRIFDVYHSPVFYMLMGLLALNLIVCSLNRFPRSWWQYRMPPFPIPEDLFRDILPERCLLVDVDQYAGLRSLETLLQEKYRKTGKKIFEHSTVFFVQRGRFSLFGFYLVHLSILVLIAGALIGSLYGLEAYVNLGEGESIEAVRPRSGGSLHKLGYTVRCDKFSIDWYDNGAPKTYRSDLSFIRNGQVILKAPLLVNHPVSVDGIRFYQASYGLSPDSRAVLTYTKGSEKSGEIIVTAGDRFELPGSRAQVEVLRIEEELMQMGPAVKLVITSPQGTVQFWVFKQIDRIKAMNPGLLSRVPLLNPGLYAPFLFSLNRIEQQFYTGLQIVRDPGLPLIAAGGCLMMAGLMMAFLMSHRRIWVRVEETDGKTRICIAGRSSRHSAGLDREIERLCRRIREKTAP